MRGDGEGQMDETELKKIDALFRHHIGILTEEFQHKLDIVAEGHEILADKIETAQNQLKGEIQRIDQRLTMAEANLSRKIDAIYVDLAAHRDDTEKYRALYGISEKKN